MKFVFGFFCVLFSINVCAWDGAVSGEISVIEVTSANNYGFRVWLKDNPPLCGNNKWAYINGADSNYQVYVSALLAAKASKQRVTIYSNKKGGEENGYCHIGHIAVR